MISFCGGFSVLNYEPQSEWWHEASWSLEGRPPRGKEAVLEWGARSWLGRQSPLSRVDAVRKIKERTIVSADSTPETWQTQLSKVPPGLTCPSVWITKCFCNKGYLLPLGFEWMHWTSGKLPTPSQLRATKSSVVLEFLETVTAWSGHLPRQLIFCQVSLSSLTEAPSSIYTL